MNMTRRSPAWTVVLLTFTLGGVLRAQQNVDSMALPVGVTGTADMGGSFQGTLLLTRVPVSKSRRRRINCPDRPTARRQQPQ